MGASMITVGPMAWTYSPVYQKYSLFVMKYNLYLQEWHISIRRELNWNSEATSKSHDTFSQSLTYPEQNSLSGISASITALLSIKLYQGTRAPCRNRSRQAIIRIGRGINRFPLLGHRLGLRAAAVKRYNKIGRMQQWKWKMLLIEIDLRIEHGSSRYSYP